MTCSLRNKVKPNFGPVVAIKYYLADTAGKSSNEPGMEDADYETVKLY